MRAGQGFWGREQPVAVIVEPGIGSEPLRERIAVFVDHFGEDAEIGVDEAGGEVVPRPAKALEVVAHEPGLVGRVGLRIRREGTIVAAVVETQRLARGAVDCGAGEGRAQPQGAGGEALDGDAVG